MTLKEKFEEMYKELLTAISKYNMDEEDASAIKDAYKEAVHQCISLNSTFRAFEQAVIDVVGEEKYAEITRKALHSGLTEEYMMESYPEYPDEEEG